MNPSSSVVVLENFDDCGLHQEFLGIEQGPPESLALRTHHSTASEAPAQPAGTFTAAPMAQRRNDVCLTADDLQWQNVEKPVKHSVSPEIKQQIIELRRRHSLAEVAQHTGLPLGTVKSICSRSGAFRDNPLHRALFRLPPMQKSSLTFPAVPELPPQQHVTGDKEIDAVLWLRQVIGTGQAALIDKAMEAGKKTRLRSARWRSGIVTGLPPSNWAACSRSFIRSTLPPGRAYQIICQESGAAV